MNIFDFKGDSHNTSKSWTVAQRYIDIAQSLSISEADVQRIHEYYKKTRKKDKETRTQMIIYDIVSQIRKENPSFSVELKKVYLVSSAFSRAWLTKKKAPNQYRSAITGKRKLSPEEVICEIQKRQLLLLEKVREYGMNHGYAEFAHALNSELEKDKKDYILPVDWKWLSKKLGSGDGKNLYSGWGFQALRLSKNVREELIRITTGRPIFPTHDAIRNNSEFREFIISFLYTWQQEKKKWWFHVALTQAIRTWNANQDGKKAKFMLPVSLYGSTRQEWLADILWIQSSHGYLDFLVAMNIPISTWTSANNIRRLYKKYEELLLPRLHIMVSKDIQQGDYFIENNVVKMSQNGLVRWCIAPYIDRVQEIYESMLIQL